MPRFLLCLAGALALAGCASAPPATPRVSLPPVPDDIKACAEKYVPAPAGAGPMTQREVVALIARLKASDEAKGGCLKRLIALYEANARIIAEALK